MATTVRGSKLNSWASGTALSIDLSTGVTGSVPAVGDLLIIAVHQNGQTTLADNNGSTATTKNAISGDDAAGNYKPNTIDGQTASIFSRRIQSGDPTTWAFTAGAGGRGSMVAVWFQNPHATVDFDVAPAGGTNHDGVSANPYNASSITTNNDNAIDCALLFLDTSSTSQISGTPSGYTVEQTVTAAEPVSFVDKVITPAGATGTRGFSTATQNTYFCISFAIRDIGAGAASLPPGAQVVAPSAIPPHQGDNWTFTRSLSRGFDTIPAKQPPGVPLVTAAAIPPHQGDNWTLTASLNRGFDTIPPKMPPGAQVVTPAAIPPHQGDNWTFIAHVLTVMPPPGRQVVTPGATQQPGPTFAPGSAIEVVSTPIPPQPPGVVSIDPGARQLAGPTFTGSLNRGFDTVPIKQPPGAQVVTPAAVPPHASDNWTTIESVYGGMAPPIAPPGLQVVTPAAVPPHASDNWTVAASLNRGFDTVPAKQPPGAQVVTPAAVPPHAADNWTSSPSLNLGFATPLPEPVGLQAIDPPPPGPHARDNFTFVGTLFLGFTAVTLPVGQQLVVRVPAYAQPLDASWLQSLDLAQTQPPIGEQLVVSVPSPRALDSSINPSLFPGMAGPVSLPSGQIVVVPPQKPKNAGDNYTFAPGSALEVVSTPQPKLPPGQQISNYVLVWRQAPNYTLVQPSPIALNSTPQRDLTYAVGVPEAKWRAGEPQSKWSAGEPATKWRARPPQE